MATEVAQLRHRSHLLDAAVGCGAVAAASTALSIMVLFVSALRASTTAGLLVGFFGAAIAFTIAAVGFFGLEMLIGSWAFRTRAHLHFPHLPARRRPR